MNQFLRELITILGGFAIFAGALAWLLKSIITHFLNKDVENYKSRLTAEATRELEHLKSQLQISAKENEVRFSKLHEKRAEVLSELYFLLDEANEAIQQFDINLKYKDSHNIDKALIESSNKKARQSCMTALNYYRKYQLYLSKELSKSIEKFVFAIAEPSARHTAYVEGDESAKEGLTGAIEKWKAESSQVPELLEKIAHEFRLILGTENGNTKEHN